MSKKRNKGNGQPSQSADADGFEMLGGGVGREMGIGEVHVGVFRGVVREMAGKKKGTKVPFFLVGDRPLLGSTVLRSRIEEGIKAGKLAEGDTIRVTRIEDGPAKRGQNAPKIYTVEVKRAS